LVLTFLVLPVWYLLTRVVPDIYQKSSKTVVCVCVCNCFRYSMFSHSDTVPACDRRMDRHTMTAYTALA